ncbi:MAG: dihydrofolate reductase [Verrucomicrobiota bacterium]
MNKLFSIVVGMSENRVIGAKGGLPWHLPEDLKWFKSLTSGHMIVMGRKTYDSIGRPLPKRRNIVVSRQSLTIPGVEVVKGLDAVPAPENGEKVFLIGGGELYRLGLPMTSEIYLTRVKRVVEGDTTFSDFESEFEKVELIRDEPEFSIEHWVRKG